MGSIKCVALYGTFTFWWQPQGMIAMHYIDFMVVTLVTSVLAALSVNRVLGNRAEFVGFRRRGEATA